MFDDKLAGDYIDAYRLLKMSTDFADTNNPKTKTRLIKYVDSLESTQFYSLDELQSGFSKMSEEDVLAMTWYYIKQFFSSSISDEKLESLMSSIVKTDADEYMEGMSYEATNLETHEKMRIVSIPNMDNFLSVICASHEAMHFFTFLLNKAKVLKNSHYEEIISIFTEKLIAMSAENDGLCDDLFKKIIGIRYDSLHNHAYGYNLIKNTPKEKIRNMDKETYDTVNYARHIAYSYFIGELYANYLFYLYLNYPNDVLKDINKVMNGTYTLPALLNKYNARLSNPAVLQNGLNTMKGASKTMK